MISPTSNADSLPLIPKRIPVVLDTDTFNEIDDQFALVHLLLSPDRFDLKGIYAAPFSNARAESPARGMLLSYDEIQRVLDRVATPRHFDKRHVFKGATRFVGDQNSAVRCDAVDHLIATAREASPTRPLFVIGIAAATNIASAIRLAPDIIERIVIVWLGAHALGWPDPAEFNLRQDVAAAQTVFDAEVKLVWVPCNGVSSHLTTTVPEVERYVEPYGAIGKFLSTRFKSYSDSHRGWSKPLWDMTAIACLLDPAWTPSRQERTPAIKDDMSFEFVDNGRMARYVYHIRRDPIFCDFFDKLENHAQAIAAPLDTSG